MLNTEQIQAFLMQVAFKELLLLMGALILLAIMTTLIRASAKLITKIFPTKRMTILNWIPLLNLVIYLTGICGAIYLILQPTRELAFGLLLSGVIAFGFAAKELLQSLVATVVLLINKPFQVGDRITFQDTYGEVLSIGLTAVTLVTLDENVVTIPSYKFIHDLVSSSSAGALGMLVTVDVFVTPAATLPVIKSLLEQLANHNQYVNTNQPITVVIRQILSNTGVVSIGLRTKCTVKDARQEKVFQTSFLLDVNQALPEYRELNPKQ